MRVRIDSSHAFTLVELLIVVAIIGILTAIAIPNLLEAQTRGKVARVLSELRNFGMATDLFVVDAGGLPLPSDENGNYVPLPSVSTPWYETRISASFSSSRGTLMQGWVEDPFLVGKTKESAQYHYSTRQYAEWVDGTPGDYDAWVESLINIHASRVLYFYLSLGPNLTLDSAGTHFAALYNPTNGTVSNGDIVYFGPGFGFRGQR